MKKSRPLSLFLFVCVDPIPQTNSDSQIACSSAHAHPSYVQYVWGAFKYVECEAVQLIS